MSAIAEAPVIVGETAPAPPPPPKTEIHVLPPTEAPVIDKGPAQPVPKKGSAMEQLREDLRKRAKDQDSSQATPPEKPAQEATPSAPTPPKGAADAPPPTTAAPSTDTKEKKNPWKLVDEWKQKYGTLEAEYAKAKQSSLAEQERADFRTKLEAAQKRADDLENEIRFVNYEKSEEFQKKYEEPYRQAVTRAGKELAEIPVQTSDGERPATIQDLWEIINLPLGRARKVADGAFGAFADDIMSYRKEIVGLLEAKTTALEDAKKNSIQRDKDREQTQQKLNGEIATHIKETWERANQEYLAHEQYGPSFKPVEGDQEGNSRLAKGFELVDRAFNENPNDPRLTPEQRAKIVRRHAAVRNRAASWGREHAWRIAAQEREEALKKELAQYKDSVPSTGGRTPAPAAPATTSAKESVFGALRKLAKPA